MRAILLLILMIPVTALGWGDTGHRTVCQIAYDELHKIVRAKVDRLIDLDPDFASFAESCLFADRPTRIRGQDHYIKVPRSSQAITIKECPMADTCLFNAIDTDTIVLSDTDTSYADKLLALKLLGHWVGDIHQPLHVSYQDDRGGNSVMKKDDLDGANLHGVWDFEIIERGMGSDFSQIAADLRTQITDAERAQWKFDSPIEWANESYQITISASTEYCVQQQGACWYSRDNMMLDDGEPRREFTASDQYLTAQKEIVVLRLKQAGVRLAAVLNASLH